MSDTLKKDHSQAHFQQTVIKLRESLEKSIISKEKAVENFQLNEVSEPYVVNMTLNFKRYP